MNIYGHKNRIAMILVMDMIFDTTSNSDIAICVDLHNFNKFALGLAKLQTDWDLLHGLPEIGRYLNPRKEG